MLVFLQILLALSCTLLDLPTSIDYFSPSYLQSHHLEASGQFSAPDSPIQWNFDVFEDSWFRLTLEPKYFSIHTTLTLTQKPIPKTILSLGFGQISLKLSVGVYTLQMDPDAFEDVNNDNLGCDKAYMYVNVVIMPLGKIKQSKLANLAVFGFPELHALSDLLQYSAFSINTDYINLKTEGLVDFIHSYNFSLDVPTAEQKNSGITGMWKINFALSHDFLTFGGLRVVLSRLDKIIDFSSENPCTNGCVFGKRDQKNTLNLHALASPGEYSISIFYVGSKSDKELFKLVGEKISMNLYSTFSPLVEKEDRVNCRAGVLPHELSSSGLLSSGFLRFSDYLIADFSANIQQTKFSIDQESVLRIVTVQSESFNVNIKLKDSTHRLIKESVFNHEANSLVDVLDPGLYYMILSEAGSLSEDTSNKFCETFQINIGLSPRNALRETVKSFQECSDEESLSELLSSVQDSLDKNGRFELLPEKVFSLGNPKDHEIVFHSQLELSEMVFVYLEVFSDFVASDLVVLLVNKDKEVFHNDEHHYLQGTLKPGNYQFMINLRSEVAGLKPTDCITFNLNIKIVKTNKKALESWKCTNHNTYSLPYTLNTLDKLGPKGSDQKLSPATVLYGKKFLAPDSNLDVYDSTKFVLQTQSRIKVLTEATEGNMKLVLLSSGKQIAIHSSNPKMFPATYSLSAALAADLIYELQIFYYPKDPKICHTYTLALEIYPVTPEEECKGKEPDESFIIHRTVDANNFEFVNNEGFSPADPRFTYKRSQKEYSKSISLEINDEYAFVSGHLISSNFGLTIEIYKEGALVEWGQFDASHRYQLNPTKLYKGSYEVLLKDLFTSFDSECIHISLSILIENFAYSKNTANLMRKTETCLFPEPPPSLNYAGLLETGKAHLHQKISSNFYSITIKFEIEEKSLIRMFVKPRELGIIELKIKKSLMGEDLVLAKVQSLTDGLHEYLEKGSYFLVISNDKSNNFKEECDFLELDLEVLSETDAKSLSATYDCKQSVGLSELSEFNEICVVFDSSKDNSLPLALPEASEVTITMSYLNALSGYISLVLNNNKNEKISESLGAENLAQIKASLDKGDYKLNLVSSSNTKIDHPCWPVQISVKLKNTAATCVAGPVPSRLISKYGGPQNPDGGVTFMGTFKVGKNPDLIFIESPKNAIMRITAISSNSQVFIEFAVFRDRKLKEKIGYSQGSLNKVSLILGLDASENGYFVVVSYVTQAVEDCLTFDLKLQIEPFSTVLRELECQVAPNKEMLPRESFSFSDSTDYTKDYSVVLSSWIRGTSTMPPFSESSDFLFSYTMSLTLSQKGILSAQILHDFLTSLFTLKLYSSDKILASSTWELIFSQQHKKFNFATILSGVILEPGEYKLVLKSGVSNRMLIKKFPDKSLCFPFSFNLDFTVFDSEANQLVSVTPNELKGHNFLEGFSIRLTFKDPVKASEVYLLSGSKEKVFPDKVRTAVQANQLTIEFLPARLKPNECYSLQVGDGLGDKKKHEYCVAGCKCNPKALAGCSQDLKCVCPEPYAGVMCEECLTGFEEDDGICVQKKGLGEYLLFGSIYTGIGICFVYLVQMIRKQSRRSERGMELEERGAVNREINLYED